MTSGNVHEAFLGMPICLFAAFASNSDKLRFWLAHALREKNLGNVRQKLNKVLVLHHRPCELT